MRVCLIGRSSLTTATAAVAHIHSGSWLPPAAVDIINYLAGGLVVVVVFY